MDIKLLRSAIKAEVAAALAGTQVVWPNVEPVELTHPRVELSFGSDEVMSDNLDPADGDEYIRGILNMTVCIALGSPGGEDTALDVVDSIRSAFQYGTRFSFTGGRYVQQTPSSVRGGFPDKTSWRTPVVTRFIAQAV